MIFMDPPGHDELRRLVSRTPTTPCRRPQQVKGVDPHGTDLGLSGTRLQVRS